MKHLEFMEMAVQQSFQGMNSNAGGPFGAVVVKDGVVVGVGHNSVTSTNDPTAHAEVMAIRAACAHLGTYQLDGCVLYTSCEPCPMCLGAIYWARPDRVYYGCTHEDAAAIGFDDAFIYEELAMPMEQRKIPMEQVHRVEAIKAFEAWAEKEDKKLY